MTWPTDPPQVNEVVVKKVQPDSDDFEWPTEPLKAPYMLIWSDHNENLDFRSNLPPEESIVALEYTLSVLRAAVAEMDAEAQEGKKP